MAGTNIPAGQNNGRKEGPGGFTKETSDKAATPSDRLKSSEVKYGGFIDKRSGK